MKYTAIFDREKITDLIHSDIECPDSIAVDIKDIKLVNGEIIVEFTLEC